jgi:hypothetical protein
LKCDNIPPRIQVFGWRLMSGALATGMRTSTRSKNIDPNCIRCGKNEDDFHLFFDCKFTQAVWFASPIGLRVESLHHLGKTQLQDVIYYILCSCKNNNTLQIMLCILWCIWKARNDLLFNRSSTSPLQVLHKAKALQREKEITNKVTTQFSGREESRELRVNQTKQNWNLNRKEPKNYTDAALKCKTPSSVNIFSKKELELASTLIGRKMTTRQSTFRRHPLQIQPCKQKFRL